MFEMSFLEIMLLGVVSLVVLGPEKLPGAIRTVSLWIGRLRRSFNSIKTDIEKEIGADEIRRQLRNEAIMDKFKQTKAQVNEAIGSVKKETDAIRKSVELEAKAAGMSSQPTPKPDTATNSAAAADQTPALSGTDTAPAAGAAQSQNSAAAPATTPAAPAATSSSAPAATPAETATAKTES